MAGPALHGKVDASRLQQQAGLVLCQMLPGAIPVATQGQMTPRTLAEIRCDELLERVHERDNEIKRLKMILGECCNFLHGFHNSPNSLKNYDEWSDRAAPLWRKANKAWKG